jgi:hypothetical protein
MGSIFHLTFQELDKLKLLIEDNDNILAGVSGGTIERIRLKTIFLTESQHFANVLSFFESEHLLSQRKVIESILSNEKSKVFLSTESAIELIRKKASSVKEILKIILENHILYQDDEQNMRGYAYFDTIRNQYFYGNGNEIIEPRSKSFPIYWKLFTTILEKWPKGGEINMTDIVERYNEVYLKNNDGMTGTKIRSNLTRTTGGLYNRTGLNINIRPDNKPLFETIKGPGILIFNNMEL